MAQTTVAPAEAYEEAPFHITVTGPVSRNQHCLKLDDTFVVADSHGDIGASMGGANGLFHCDTRFLSHLELLIDGVATLRLGSATGGNNVTLDADLTNPDVIRDDHVVLSKDTIHIARALSVGTASLNSRIAITNHAPSVQTFNLTLIFDSDFADIFEVRGMLRPKRGRVQRRVISDRSVTIGYTGLHGKPFSTTVSFEPAPESISGNSVTYLLVLSEGQTSVIYLTAACKDGSPPVSPARAFLQSVRLGRRRRRALTDGAARVVSSDPILNEILSRSAADLYMLVSDCPEGPYPYAGIPWYSTTFGRDGLITALAMLPFDPQLAKGVLKRLTYFQAKAVQSDVEAEPGKILHEMRAGEMAALGEVPFGLYYGSVDATPLFVLLAGQYLTRTGDLAFVREIWPAVEQAVAWMDLNCAKSPLGFLTYAGTSENGLSNQCWKDSSDSIFHAGGSRAAGPIAAVEVQGYVYAAKCAASSLAHELGFEDSADRIRAEAERFRNVFEAAFWDEELGTYVLAIDGLGEPCRVRSSNAGHALFSGIASGERAQRVIAQLMSPDFHAGWGVRTIARSEARYNPMSYHNGSIWPHDNAIIGEGCSRYGRSDATVRIFDGLMDAARSMDSYRLPELFCGFRRRKLKRPILYPVACAPQAWASAAPFMLIKALTGLTIDAKRSSIRFSDVHMPRGTQSLTFRNLRLNEGSVDIQLRSDASGAVHLDVLAQSGSSKIAAALDQM